MRTRPEGPELVARLKSLTPEGDVLSTKLNDPPMFMFSTVAVKTREHQIVYDIGNSHCLYCTGVPADLWGCRMRKGPHALGAVGATMIMGGNSWACLDLEEARLTPPQTYHCVSRETPTGYRMWPTHESTTPTCGS